MAKKFKLTAERGYAGKGSKAKDAADIALFQWTRASTDRGVLVELITQETILHMALQLRDMTTAERRKELSEWEREDLLPLYEALITLMEREAGYAHDHVRRAEQRPENRGKRRVEVDCSN